MGLDALDLCFRLEKRLGVKIPGPEIWASFFDTPKTLHRYLMAKLSGDCRQVPAIQPSVMEVSKAVNRVAGWWRLKTSADLNKQFSGSYRATSWDALQRELGVSLPPLEQAEGEMWPKIPPQCDTIISLTYWIIEHHPERVDWLPVSCERTGAMANHTWTEGEVWEVMCDCMVAALGVKREEISPDVRMVEDLGME